MVLQPAIRRTPAAACEGVTKFQTWARREITPVLVLTGTGVCVYTAVHTPVPVAGTTVKLIGTKLRRLPPLVLGGIIENQNSDFVIL
jgi:hypothetical protein